MTDKQTLETISILLTHEAVLDIEKTEHLLEENGVIIVSTLKEIGVVTAQVATDNIMTLRKLPVVHALEISGYIYPVDKETKD